LPAALPTSPAHLYDPSRGRDRRSLHEDAVDSEYETDKMSDRIRRAVNASAKEGRPHGKNLYGYRRTYVQGPSGPQLDSVEPDPVTAPIVREARSEEHTSELQSRFDLVCRLLLEKKKKPHTRTRLSRGAAGPTGSGRCARWSGRARPPTG